MQFAMQNNKNYQKQTIYKYCLPLDKKFFGRKSSPQNPLQSGFFECKVHLQTGTSKPCTPKSLLHCKIKVSLLLVL
jgi:hypothetical protein